MDFEWRFRRVVRLLQRGSQGAAAVAAVVPFADRRSIGSGRFWSFVVCKRISRGTDSAPRRPMAAATSKMIKRFGGKQKTAPELAKSLRDSLLVLSRNEKEDKKIQKSIEEVSVHLTTIKTMLYGTGDQESQAEFTILLVQDIYTNNLLLLMIENLTKIDFESRKDVAHIFNNLLRRQLGTRSPTVDHICSHPNIIKALLAGYEVQEIALNCGTMLRECFRHEELARMVLHSDGFYKFFDYVELSTFDIASDAFVTFKDLLTRHQNLAAEFLQANYDKVFSHYERLLNSENYVTRRQALKLLGELLLDRQNFTMMTRYISSADNLKLIMNILKEKSRNIQFEAFHVFKVFVANPNKPRPIQDILYRNREKLDEFLSKFHNDRLDDDLFNDEKAYLRKQIKDMKPPA